jgi:hypothetical protein
LCVPYSRGRRLVTTSEGQASSPTSQLHHSDCVRDCWEQVVVSMSGAREGRFYHNHPPGLVATQIVDAVPGRPPGCNVIFHPLPDKNVSSHNGTTRDWGRRPALGLRRPVVVRAEPFFDENKQDASLWKAFCYTPCQEKADCGARVGFHCSSAGTCIRNQAYWMEDPHAHPEMVLVTAVSGRTLPNLIHLKTSLQQWDPQEEHPLVVVYHLGGVPLKQLEDMESLPNVRKVEWKSSLPLRYQGHNLTEDDNWKPIIWNQTLQEYPSMLWFDADSILSSSGLPTITPIFQERLEQNGMVLGPLRQHTSSSRPSSPTTEIIAFMRPSRYVDLVAQWAECALDTACSVSQAIAKAVPFPPILATPPAPYQSKLNHK